MRIFSREPKGAPNKPSSVPEQPKVKRIRRKAFPKSCEVCGKVFTAHMVTARYCSHACRQAASAARKVVLTDKELAALEALRRVPDMARLLQSIQHGQLSGSRGLRMAMHAIAAYIAFLNTSQKTS